MAHRDIDEKLIKNKDGTPNLEKIKEYYPHYLFIAKQDGCDCLVVNASGSKAQIALAIHQAMSDDRDFEMLMEATVEAHRETKNRATPFTQDTGNAMEILDKVAKIVDDLKNLKH